MEQFIDYYAEFEIDRTADCNVIRNILGSLESDYLQQRSVCLTSDEMEIVQKLLDLIDEAIYNLANEERRKKYDKKLEKLAASGELNSQQTKAKNDYEQAVIYESKGKAKEAILFVERAIAQNIYNKDAYALMIRCCFQIGEHQKAIDVAEKKAIRIYPDEMSFYQYAARIRTIHADYEGAQEHITAMLQRDPNHSAGHIEKAVRLLYMSEDDGFSDDQRMQARTDAQTLIDHNIAQNCDDEYRNGIATALIGLSERHYSEYEGVPCKIIATSEDYSAILDLHEWAGRVSNDDNIQSALNDIRDQGKRKYNTDNTRALLCMSIFAFACIFGLFGAIVAWFEGASFSDGAAGLLGVAMMLIFFVLPWVLLMKVSFRPMWMIDRIRYTGHVDPLERSMVAYGQFFMKTAKCSWVIMLAIVSFAISMSNRDD